MSVSTFRFKHFEVAHDKSTMKVGTDGVLLGAWLDTTNVKRILDIGTGCGLIALIAAQRSQAFVTGVEIDEASAIQAKENATKSPFASKVEIVQADILHFTDAPFDLIVSNPPFFKKSLTCPNPIRSNARHATHLTFEKLIQKAASLLSPDGRFAVILPCDVCTEFEHLCYENKLYPSRFCAVSTVQGRSPKRLLMEYSFHRIQTEHRSIFLSNRDGSRSEALKIATSDLYL